MEKRRPRSEITVIAFIAAGYKEALGRLSDSLRKQAGFPWIPLAVFVVFVLLTAPRFFIGGHLHLRNPDLLAKKKTWRFDSLAILLECVIIGLAGGRPLPPENLASNYGFLGLLLTLYAIDVGVDPSGDGPAAQRRCRILEKLGRTEEKRNLHRRGLRRI